MGCSNSTTHMNICIYYQARLNRPNVIHIISILKSFDNMCFDRALNPATDTFEFFVPEHNKKTFLEIMHFFAKEGIVSDLKELPNRLMKKDL